MMKPFTMIPPLFLMNSIILGQQDNVFKLHIHLNHLEMSLNLVEVHVSVVDAKDRPIGNLVKDNFQLFEDRVAQNIAVFKHEDIPVSLGLVIDNSRSIAPRKQRLDAAALSFIRKSNADDEAF